MTQKEIDTLFSITITIHENEWFGKRKEPRDREEVQEWVSKTIAETHGIYTIPCGMSWGTLVSKELFDKHWKEHSKITE